MTNTIKKIYILSVLLCVLLLVSCMEQEVVDNMEKENEQNATLTKKYIMEKLEEFDISEEELEGIDIEEVFKYQDWILDREFETKDEVIYFLESTYEDVKKINELHKWQEENGFGYLLSAKKNESEIPQFSTIKNIIYEKEHEFGTTSELLSFANNMYYYNPVSSIAWDYRNADTMVEITDEDKQEMISALEKANISEWHNRYNGVDQGESYQWVLGLEFDDGTVITYHYVKNRDNPDGLRYITGALTALD